jgi:hypothetical protein
MLQEKSLENFATLESSLSLHNIIILAISSLMILAGCTNDGAGGPILSSLSSPTDETAALESDHTHDSTESISGEEGEEDPIITMTSTSDGITARLTWDHPPDVTVTGYSIHYGKRSAEEPVAEESPSEESNLEETSSEAPSSCSYGERLVVQAPPATITGLEPNTRYFFAIRALSETKSESICSNEITVITPPAQS